MKQSDCHIGHIRPLVALCLLIFFFAAPVFAQQAGDTAPDFTLNDMQGKKVSFSGYKGKVVILNFWATWCVPCRAEMPSLNNLYHEYKDKGLMVLAITIDPSVKPVQSFIEEKKLSFPVLRDPDKEVYFDSYAVMALPTTIVIDRKGIIVEKIMGEQTWDSPAMKEKISKLLGGVK